MRNKLIEMISVLGCLFGCSGNNEGFQSLGADEYETALKDSSVVCLDVRTSDEFASDRIGNAINVDVKKAGFEETVMNLPKDKTIAVYCKGGVRSKDAARVLVKNGYKVINLKKGMDSWKKAGKPVETEEMDQFTTSDGTTIKMFSIKHASIRMQIADKWVYFDPVTTATLPETDYTKLPKADFIFFTHDHFDHLDSLAVAQLEKEETVIITNASGQMALGKGEVMANGDSLTIADGWTVEAVPAYNISENKLQFHPKGRDNGYVLTVNGFRIYVGGDLENIPELENIKDIDVAFLPCNLPYTMTPEQLAKAAAMIKPKVLFPYHYGETDTKKIQKALDGSGIDVRIRHYQ